MTTSTAMQLTLSGGEVPHREVIAARVFGGVQVDVLRLLALEPRSTSQLEALLGRSGGEAVRRLRDRGVVEKHVGLWFISAGPFE